MASLRDQLRRKRPKLRRGRAQRLPSTVVLAYYAELRRMMRSARELVRTRLIPLVQELSAAVSENRGDSYEVSMEECEQLDGHRWSGGQCLYCPIHLDASRDPTGRVNRLMDRVSESFYRQWSPEKLTKLARKYVDATSEYQKDQLASQIKSRLGIDPMVAEPGLAQRLKDATAENVALIKSVPQTYFDQVEQRVIAGMRAGSRHETIAAEMAERFEVAESRAKLIARDQTLKLYGELNAARQGALGVSRYVWRSVSDQRVRDAHSEFDGNTYSWDAPPGDGSPEEGTHPGTAINCRCYADPVLEDVVGEGEEE